MRGKRTGCGQQISDPRITPAHAGKTRIRRIAVVRRQDHPRACGENTTMQQAIATTTGSPPRMRGKLDYKQKPQLERRITPAHAGKTIPLPVRQVQYEDHPRACGENQRERGSCEPGIGSPPRMRGKRVLIPCSLSAHRDHPRACGENGSALFGKCLTLGSPPRMRGKLVSDGVPGRRARITPAHAGKTTSRPKCR